MRADYTDKGASKTQAEGFQSLLYSFARVSGCTRIDDESFSSIDYEITSDESELSSEPTSNSMNTRNNLSSSHSSKCVSILALMTVSTMGDAYEEHMKE